MSVLPATPHPYELRGRRGQRRRMERRADDDKSCCLDASGRDTAGRLLEGCRDDGRYGRWRRYGRCAVGAQSDDVGNISCAIALLECIVQRGGSLCCDTVQTLSRLVSVPPSTARCDQGTKTAEEGDWDCGKLLQNCLSSIDLGLLSIDFASLSKEVREVLKQAPSIALTRSAAELWMPIVAMYLMGSNFSPSGTCHSTL
jgi:hypothetical protein